MKSLLLIICLLLVSTAHTYSGRGDFKMPTPADDRELWRQIHLPKRCELLAGEINRSLYIYDSALEAKFSDNTVSSNRLMSEMKRRKLNTTEIARSNLLRIHQILASAETDQSGCFDSLAMHFAFGSLGGMNSLYSKMFLTGHLKPMTTLMKAASSGWGQSGNGIIAAYDCIATTIYFDPYHGPNDIRATLEHELSHLVRDKFRDWFVPPTAPQLNAIEEAIADELISAFSGAYDEMRDRALENFPFDVTLYNYNGDLAGILSDVDGFYGVPDLTPKSDYRTVYYFIKHAALQPRASVRLRRLIHLIAGVYAPGAAYSDSKIIAWLGSLTFDNVGELLQLDDVIETIPKSRYQNLQRFLSQPTAICKRFSHEMETGELNGYLGRKVHTPAARKTRPSNKGTRPGSEGTKPSSQVLRPCVKPPPEF